MGTAKLVQELISDKLAAVPQPRIAFDCVTCLPSVAELTYEGLTINCSLALSIGMFLITHGNWK